MIFNGVDLKKKYGNKIKVGQQTIKRRDISSKTEWPEGANFPVENKSPSVRFYEVSAELIVIGESKIDAEVIISNIQADCMSGEMYLNGLNLNIKGELKKVESEFIKRWAYKITLLFNAWDKAGQEISIPVQTSGPITIQGNMETPCIIEIAPDSHETSFTISGVARNPITGEDEPIIIKNLTAGKKVIINGEDGTVLQESKNKYPETEFWEFPSLLPGTNRITLSSTAHAVTIKYKPRYF